MNLLSCLNAAKILLALVLAVTVVDAASGQAGDELPPGLVEAIKNPDIPAIIDATILSFDESGGGEIRLNTAYKLPPGKNAKNYRPKLIRGYALGGSAKVAPLKLIVDGRTGRYLFFVDGDKLYSTYNHCFQIREQPKGEPEVAVGFNGGGGPWRPLQQLTQAIAKRPPQAQDGDVVKASKKTLPEQLPAPNQSEPNRSKPVKIYILSGQSNMVGIGQVNGGSTRWSGVTDASVSVYAGAYSPNVDYEKQTPLKVQSLEVYGGVKPTQFPGGGIQISRGNIELGETGTYVFNPGYGDSTFCIMELDGVEVYRREVGSLPIQKPAKIEVGKKHRFRITFLTDAANGLGWYTRTDIPGTLTTLVKTNGKFPHLVDENGNWIERNDVWYKGLVTATANQWLSIGCGATSNQIGPELQFGHIIGHYHDEPVIVLKTSQGNRSLGWDFLPPGSQSFTYEGRTYAGYGDSIPSWTDKDPGKKVDWYGGLQYDQCFKAVHEVLDDFGNQFPQYKDQGYEIAGFVWWQGHKDGNAAHASRYEQNLVALIKHLRSEFKAPKVPFVISTIGFGGWEMAGPHLAVANAQLAVSGEQKKYPEFIGNVLTVESRDFWKDAAISPRDQGFHYNGNAETYMMVGDALGRGMVGLLEQQPSPK